ncbi:hypothetical protein RSOLAG1IB_08480 [Rhizoctonia solani AG-1 IB]|uniref:Uncharacterized protein n=1 Tax=Thanatephorus cucumeris (strain AG1-IB / isolate 7/3/14) TaxID=1108050 RepID=A0A0B7FM29_THACB|nr:hypothetical protein RSOLAG1IB_08480 [Rhizoctonia solani AG-1 IB]
MASKPAEFAQWAIRARLESQVNRVIPLDPFFDKMRYIQRASIRFPSWLANKNSPNLCILPAGYQKWVEKLISKLSRNPTYSLSGDEDPDLPSFLRPLLHICERQTRLSALGRQHTEMDIRAVIDSLVIYTYEAEQMRTLRYSAEQTLKLPFIRTKNFDVATITADGVHSLEITDLDLNEEYKFCEIVSAIKGVGAKTPTALSLVHCVTEYKRTGSGVNGAMMGMVSALYQKRVLGLDHFVFGIYQCRTEFIRIVAAAWQDNKIKVYEVGSYSLKCPVQVIQFYFVLREIKRLGYEYADEVKSSNFALLQLFKEDPPGDIWARDDLSAIPETTDESDAQEKYGESSGHTDISVTASIIKGPQTSTKSNKQRTQSWYIQTQVS